MNTRVLTNTSEISNSKRSSIFSQVLRAFEVRSQRLSLAELDALALKDIGICEAERDIESARKFWDI